MQIVLETTEAIALEKIIAYAESLDIAVHYLPTLPKGKSKEEKQALLKKIQALDMTDYPLQDALEALNNEHTYQLP